MIMQDNLDTRISTKVDRAQLFDMGEGKPPKVSDVPLTRTLKVMAVISFIVAVVPLLMLFDEFVFAYLMYAFFAVVLGFLLIGLRTAIEFLYLIMLNSARKQVEKSDEVSEKKKD